MKPNLILIDTSWLLFRSKFAFKDLSVDLGEHGVLPSGHLYGVMKTLKQMTEAFPDAQKVFCLDGSSVHNKEIDPEYKANRNHDGFVPLDDVGVLTSMILTYPNTKVVFHKDFEADEIIASLVRMVEGDERFANVVIFSGDNDMLQLLSPQVVWSNKFANGKFDLVTEEVYLTDEKWTSKYAGTRVECLPLFRALVGDSSDNLKGFPRLRKKQAKEWAERYVTADALCEANISQFPEGFVDFVPKLKTNYQIMKLPTKADIENVFFNVATPNNSPFKDGEDMFNLYRMRTVSLKPLSKPNEVDLAVWLAKKDELNSLWKSRLV